MGLADNIECWIAEHIEGAGLSGIVLGMSGGIDSAVVSGLCARAVGPEQVLGINMPAHSMSSDAASARLAAETFGIEYRTIELSNVYDDFLEILPEGSQLANANIKPRLRMITLYHFANTLNRMVIGTGNRSELMVGYFTKFGDGGTDLLPIAGLLKSEVRELARELGVPEEIINRPPSAGLWEGQTDEEELGISYEDLDRTLAAIESGDTAGIDQNLLTGVETMIRNTEHKRNAAPIYRRNED